MLVEGDALWVVDDGECPQLCKEVPDHVMIWASKAEPSTFWARAIDPLNRPANDHAGPGMRGEGVEIFCGNITQWTRDVRELLLQQDIQIAMMIEKRTIKEPRWK